MAFTLPKPKECKECGSGGMFHRVKYISIIVDSIGSGLFSSRSSYRAFAQRIQSFEQKIAPHFFHACIRLGLAKKQTEMDEGTQLLAQMLWHEARERGITVWEFRLFNLPRNIFFAEFPNGTRITYEGIPLPLHGVHQEPWLDNKAILKDQFRRIGLPIAKGGTAITKKGALKIFNELKAPVIVKPHSGSGSRHTTLHIMNEHELLQAFAIAKEVSPAAVIEEELVGAVYRATVVDGKLSATLRRDPPSVVGDGKKTIRELVDEANKHPARSGPYFSKIKIDNDALKELDWQKHTLGDVLPKGKRVTFHQKVNWSVGGTTADVSDEVHSDNRELFERVAKVLKAPIVGIDFIIEDMSKSWKRQKRCGIIECNSMPFFDNHHLPFEGKPRNVAGAIWDMVENESKAESRKSIT